MTQGERSPSRRAEYVKAVVEVLNDQGGEMRSREVMKQIEARMQPTPHKAERLEKTGYIRWCAALQLDSIRLVKAGWLRKKWGTWFLTDEGRKQVRLPAEELFRVSREQYVKWKHEQADAGSDEDIEGAQHVGPAKSAADFEQAVDLAKTGIQDFIQAMDPYDFQDLVAALLRGMGYHTPFVAPPGKDGGIDVLAYRDPFGTVEPARPFPSVNRVSNTRVHTRSLRS